jgi:hypothetical protein
MPSEKNASERSLWGAECEVLSGRQVDFGPKRAQAGAMGDFRRLKPPALGFHEFFE